MPGCLTNLYGSCNHINIHTHYKIYSFLNLIHMQTIPRSADSRYSSLPTERHTYFLYAETCFLEQYWRCLVLAQRTTLRSLSVNINRLYDLVLGKKEKWGETSECKIMTVPYTVNSEKWLKWNVFVYGGPPPFGIMQITDAMLIFIHSVNVLLKF